MNIVTINEDGRKVIKQVTEEQHKAAIDSEKNISAFSTVIALRSEEKVNRIKKTLVQMNYCLYSPKEGVTLKECNFVTPFFQMDIDCDDESEYNRIKDELLNHKERYGTRFLEDTSHRYHMHFVGDRPYGKTPLECQYKLARDLRCEFDTNAHDMHRVFFSSPSPKIIYLDPLLYNNEYNQEKCEEEYQMLKDKEKNHQEDVPDYCHKSNKHCNPYLIESGLVEQAEPDTRMKVADTSASDSADCSSDAVVDTPCLTVNEADMDQNIVRLFRKVNKNYPRIAVGNRNNLLFDATCRYLRYYCGHDALKLKAVLYPAYTMGLGLCEVEACFRSAVSYQRTYTPSIVTEMLEPSSVDDIEAEEDALDDESAIFNQEIENLIDNCNIDMDTEIPPAEYTLMTDDTPFFQIGDIHAIVAHQKQGKSLALSVMAAAFLSPNGVFRLTSQIADGKAVYFDTEMNPSDTQVLYKRIFTLSGLSEDEIKDRLSVFSLRKLEAADKLKLIKYVIRKIRPQFVVIDGIIDVMSTDFNNLEESKALVEQLMIYSAKYKCAIINVIHFNPGSDKARGHIGTMLPQKAGNVLKVEKDDDSGIFTVSSFDSRHTPVPEWSFTFDENGEIISADALAQAHVEHTRAENAERRRIANEETARQREQCAIDFVSTSTEQVDRKQLNDYLMDSLHLGKSSVSSIIKGCIEKNLLQKVNNYIIAVPQQSADEAEVATSSSYCLVNLSQVWVAASM